MRGVQGDAKDPPLQGFCRRVLPVANDRVAYGCKLHSDLVLQPRHQRNADEGSLPRRLFNGIPKFSARRVRIAFRGQLLEHPVSPKMVNQRPFFNSEMTANDRQILPHRSMAEELPNQGVPIRPGFCEEEDARRKTIDAMYDQGSLSLRLQLRRKKRQG